MILHSALLKESRNNCNVYSNNNDCGIVLTFSFHYGRVASPKTSLPVIIVNLLE